MKERWLILPSKSWDIRLKGQEYGPHDGWESWYWDEWLILSEKGNYYWIEHDEGNYSIYEVLNPKGSPTRDIGRHVFAGRRLLPHQERGDAVIVFIERDDLEGACW